MESTARERRERQAERDLWRPDRPAAAAPPLSCFSGWRPQRHRQVLKSVPAPQRKINFAASGGGRYDEGCTIRFAPLFHAALKIWMDGVEDARWAEGGV